VLRAPVPPRLALRGSRIRYGVVLVDKVGVSIVGWWIVWCGCRVIVVDVVVVSTVGYE
jgi:hypothetical protein